MQIKTPIVSAVVLLVIGNVLASGQWSRVQVPANRDLRNMAFADAQNGWIVGDGGTILNTADGGQTWQPQPSGTNAALLGVYLTDYQNGWSVGKIPASGG